MTTCSQRGTVYGCGSEFVPFSAEALPALVFPVLALLVAVAAAVAAGTPRASFRARAAAAVAFGFVAAPLVLSGAWPLVVAQGLLVGAALASAGRARAVLPDLAAAAAVSGAAIAAAYGATALLALARGMAWWWVFPAPWILVAFSTVAGLALGLWLAADPRRRWPLATGALVGHAVAGGAALVAGLAGPLPAKHPAFVLVWPCLLGAVAVVLGSAALGRLGLWPDQPRWGLASLAAVALAPFLLGTFLVLTALEPDILRADVPRPAFLPSTSTR